MLLCVLLFIMPSPDVLAAANANDVTIEAAVFCANLFVAKLVNSPVAPICVPDIKDEGSVVNIQ